MFSGSKDFGHVSDTGRLPPSSLNPSTSETYEVLAKTEKIANDKTENATSSYAPKTCKITLPNLGK